MAPRRLFGSSWEPLGDLVGPFGGPLVGAQVLLGDLLGSLGGLLGSSMDDLGVLLGPHESRDGGCMQTRKKKKDFMKKAGAGFW